MGVQKIANVPAYTSAKPYAIFAVFDLELTGLDPDSDRVIEAAIVLCDENAQPVFAFETLIDPGRDTGPVHIHHITNDMVTGQPTFPEIGEDMAEVMNNRVIVGLNNSLDFSCLKREFDEMGIKFKPGSSLDLSPILRDSLFTDTYYDEIMAAIESQEIEHRAMADTLVAAEILPYALQFARDHPDRVRAYNKCEVIVHEREPRVIAPRTL